jgi:para-nitrobenzyl esterase
MPFGTQYGHAPLPGEREAGARWRRAAAHLDVIVGWTSEETSLFVDFSPALARVFALPRIGRLLRTFALGVSTDIVYRVPGRRFARSLAKAGGFVATYELAWRPRGGPLGATHTIDLALLFPGPLWRGAGVLGEVRPEELPPLGEAVRSTWAGFAATGRVLDARTARIPVPMRFRILCRRRSTPAAKR